jgi:hypothetical protein
MIGIANIRLFRARHGRCAKEPAPLCAKGALPLASRLFAASVDRSGSGGLRQMAEFLASWRNEIEKFQKMISSQRNAECFLMKGPRLNRPVLIFLLLSAALAPVNAEELCSREGKAKIRAAHVTETQLMIICPASLTASTAMKVDYDDVQSAIFDTQNAVGKTIALNALHGELRSDGKGPFLLTKINTNTGLTQWYVYFDRSLTSIVSDLGSGERFSAICRIRELGVFPECELISLSVNRE